mgnify:CR=1 FL=1
MSKFTGIKTVEVEDSPGSWGGSQINLGTPLESSPSLTQEPQEVPDAQGRMLYGGNKDTSEFHIASFTNFAALKTKMESDTEVDVRITFMDDTTEVIHVASMVQVSKSYSAAVGSRNYMIVKFSKYRIT